MKKFSLYFVISLIIAIINITSVSYANYTSDEFIRSQTDEYHENPIYYINIKGHELSVKCTGSYGSLYADGKFIDDNVLWNFFSDGNYVYYSKDNKILRANIETGQKESIVYDNYATVEGVYKNKYLYYGSYKYTDVTRSLVDLIIYDLENNEEIGYVVDVSSLVVTNNKIYTTPCTGDLCELPITEMNPDGSQPKQIADDAFYITGINNQLYYSAVHIISTDENFSAKEQVRKYDPQTGITKNLTDYIYGFVKNINSEYAIFETPENKNETVYYKKEIKVVLNGDELIFDQPPIITNDRVMVPIRAIFEAMNYNINWNNETQTAEAVKSNNKITVQINNNIIPYTVNGVSGIYECDVYPQIISDRTLVPVRAIAESAGCDVQWDGDNMTVIIEYNH